MIIVMLFCRNCIFLNIFFVLCSSLVVGFQKSHVLWGAASKKVIASLKMTSTISSKSSPSQVNTKIPGGADNKMKLGVLLLNLGGPESQKDVEGFLYNLFADPDIIRLPNFLSSLQKPLAYFIAKRRAPKSSAAYRSIGGGSPIVKYDDSLFFMSINSKCCLFSHTIL